jgi:hypothetical protein
MKKIICIITAVCAVFANCSTGNSKASSFDIQSCMELSVEPGEYWQGKMKVFIFSINKTPQMAAWIEDSNGNYISTISVTSRSAKKNWRSSPKEGRPEALPVWEHAVANKISQNSIDAVSSASTKEKINAKVADDFLINGDEYNIYLEVNHSFDYNEFWTEANSGVNGQPSVIYHAKFFMGNLKAIDLVPIGHGSVDGSSGKITPELSSLTTALKIIKNARLTSSLQ